VSSPQEVIQAAQNYIDAGYKEGENNNTVFGKWYGLNKNP